MNIHHAEKAVHQYKNILSLEEQGVAERFLEYFSEEVMRNTQLFETTEGVIFPYTFINLVDFAMRLLGRESLSHENPETSTVHSQYIFGSSLTIDEGDSMVFIEETLHQVVKRLPKVIKDIQAGKIPQNTQIYNLGFPTNKKGYVNRLFLEKAEKDPYRAFAHVYGEFIHGQKVTPHTELYGISMGGNFAIGVAEVLLDSNHYSQDPESQLPKIRIRVESPVSLSVSKIKFIQIPIGFILDSIIALVRDIMQNKNPPNTVTSVSKSAMKEAFDKKADDQLSKDQKSMKGKVIWSLVKRLGEFTPRQDIKTIRVFGNLDMSLRAKGNKNIHTPGRTHVANMMHLRPFFDSPSEIKRLRKLLETLK